jgi:hypothetical protein
MRMHIVDTCPKNGSVWNIFLWFAFHAARLFSKGTQYNSKQYRVREVEIMIFVIFTKSRSESPMLLFISVGT